MCCYIRTNYAGSRYCFGSVCLSVCLSVCACVCLFAENLKQILAKNWYNLVRVCIMVNAWSLEVDIWLQELFSYFFFNSGNTFRMAGEKVHRNSRYGVAYLLIPSAYRLVAWACQLVTFPPADSPDSRVSDVHFTLKAVFFRNICSFVLRLLRLSESC